MPKMRNISKRQFIIGGKTLKQGETGEFAQQVIDRHLAMYGNGELEQVFDEPEQKAPIKEETPPVVAENETTETVADNATVEEVSEDAPAPKKRGRKPKAKG